MGDRLTVLRCHANLHMAKIWKSDGSILPYDSAKTFHPRTEPVTDIHELSALLSSLEADPQACIVRGTPKTDVTSLRRLLENFDDKPLHTLLVEVDNYRPLLSDPLTAPEDAALEYVAECLPSPFHGVSFHWQLSNSAGAPGNEGKFKAHLWFWLRTPYDSATLKAWAKSKNLQLDTAVLQPVQVHFTAAPVFEAGRVDPVPQRSGFHRGAHDEVFLEIDVSALEIRGLRTRQRGEDREVEDPLADWLEANWETWGPAGGGIAISCPFEEKHSSGAPGDTSTAYFPAGTNGYLVGAFKCLHTSCEGRSQEEFKAAVGWSDQRMAALAEPQDISSEYASPPIHINGKVINDPLILPPFERDNAGSIKTTLNNVLLGIRSPIVCHSDVVWDKFRCELMIRETGTDGWRSFVDADAGRLRIALEHGVQFKNPVGRELMRDALGILADEQVFDSAVDWLSRVVPPWDGIPRIERFWPDYLQTEDSAYTRALGLYSWTAQAGRVLSPGCQVDMAPVLISPEGYAKTSVIAAISPAREFFAEFNLSHDDEKLARLMRGCLVGELAELRGISARDGEAIKSWITRREEKWTPKYQEYARSLSRRMVFYGTTNDEDFLQPHMGERRWLPVMILRQIPVDQIVEDRLQLWAEGRDRYLENGVMWQDVERLARGEREVFKAEDAWCDALMRWLERPDMAGERPKDREWVKTLDVAEGALGIAPRQLKRADQLRIGKLLREAGFVDAVRRIEGKSTKVWIFPKKVR